VSEDKIMQVQGVYEPKIIDDFQLVGLSNANVV
jgi:hypothetical protein